MKKLFILALASSLCMVSCSDDLADGSVATPSQGESGAVTFLQSIASRVTGEEFDNNDTIAIYPSDGETLTSTTAVMYDYSSSDSKFAVSSGYKDITISDGDIKSYVATYPSTVGTSGTISPLADQTQMDFEDYDLLVAEALNQATGTVTLQFAHKMSMLSITVEVEDYRESDAGKDYSITPSISAKKDLYYDIINGSYSASGEVVAITPSADSDESSTTIYSAIIAPQDIAADTVVASISIVASSDNADGGSFNAEYSWSDAAGITFEAGKSYSYKWVVGLYDYKVVYDNVSFVGASDIINDWDYKTVNTTDAAIDVAI